MTADGFSLDDKGVAIVENDIPDLLRCWQERDTTTNQDLRAKAFFVAREAIEANGYDLSINWYEEMTYEKPMVILQRLRELEGEIRGDVDVLEGMLG